MMMRLCWQVFAVAIIFFATPSVAEPTYGGRLFGHVQNSREFAPPLILVAEETDGKVSISYNAPEYLQTRHNLPAELLPNIVIVGALVAKAAE